MRLVVIAAIFVASFIHINVVNANGICYDPSHVSPVTEKSIISDLQKIKNAGYTSVRVYSPTHGNINLGDLIIKQGLNASLTIPLNGDVGKNIQAAIDSAYRPNKAMNTMVTQIAVGNENLANSNQVPQQMFDIFYRLKASVPHHVKIGTVQRSTEYLVPGRSSMPGLKPLLNACDFVGVNIHPIFTPNTRAESAIHIVDGQWKQLGNIPLSKEIPRFSSKLMITEVGWPSGGYDNGLKNWGSREGAIRFLNDFNYWTKQNKLCNECTYFFQMFDQPQRRDGPFEAHFGVAEYAGQYNKQY